MYLAIKTGFERMLSRKKCLEKEINFLGKRGQYCTCTCFNSRLSVVIIRRILLLLASYMRVTKLKLRTTI